MTIKRRLFISNILMIVIPVVLCVIFATVMSLAMMGIFGNFGGRSLDDERFYQAKSSISKIDGSNLNEDELLRAVDNIGRNYENEHITVSVYKAGQPLGAPALDTPLLPTALEQTGLHTLILDHTALFVREMGEYHIILTDTHYYISDDTSYLSYMIMMGFGMLVLIIVIISLTNRILTRIMVKSIMTPIDTLSYGVEQIRDGNLTFRLDYLGKDEFGSVCTAFNDMADRLHKLEDARQKYEENRKELIAGISHDLRTPLTSIKAYLEGIEKGVAQSPERQQKYLDIIKSKTADLEHIINQLFLFSKLDIGEFPMNMEPVDIGQIVSELINGLTEEYTVKGLVLTVRQSVSGVCVNTDMVWLRNVVINILENSVKYKTAGKGTVIIECLEINDYIEIRLTDDGPGVPKTALDKLFDVFYRADPSRNTRGSGLGLAISAQIIKHMGGNIFARLPQGGGLAIVLRLPVISDGRRIAE